MNEQGYSQQIEDYWGTLWKQQKSGLDLCERHVRFKFAYFLRPALDNLPQGASVCEIGSGNCQWLLLCKAYRPDIKLAGVDLSETASEIAQHLGIQHCRADIRSVPLPDACYDFVYSFGVIEHVHETLHAYREQYRLARTYCVVDVPNLYSLPAFSTIRAVKRRNLSAYEDMIEFGKRFTPVAFKKMTQEVIGTDTVNVTYRANYLVFPHIRGWGSKLDQFCPDWLRASIGHNIGAIIKKG